MPQKELKLFFSRRRNGEVNFGDDISPLLVEAILNRPVVHARVSGCDYAAIGSLMEMIEERRHRRLRRMRFSPIRLWGTGCLTTGTQISSFLMKPLALRGVLTKQRLGNRHDVPLGDPGLLFDRLYEPKSGKKYKWGLIMHYSDEQFPIVQAMLDQTPNVLCIPISGHPMETLRLIGQCEYIASSSLHGLVAADCFRIPNVRLRVGPHLDHSDSKFHDYASAISRPDLSAIQAPDHGNLDKIVNLDSVDTSYFDNISGVANRLERALIDAS